MLTTDRLLIIMSCMSNLLVAVSTGRLRRLVVEAHDIPSEMIEMLDYFVSVTIGVPDQAGVYVWEGEVYQTFYSPLVGKWRHPNADECHNISQGRTLWGQRQ